MLPSSCAVLYYTWCSIFFQPQLYLTENTVHGPYHNHGNWGLISLVAMVTGVWLIQSLSLSLSHSHTHTHTHTHTHSLSLTHSLTMAHASPHIQHNIYCATCIKSQWSDNNVQHSSITSVTPQPHTTSGSDFRQIWAMWQHSIVFTFVLPLHLHYCVFIYCLKHTDMGYVATQYRIHICPSITSALLCVHILFETRWSSN